MTKQSEAKRIARLQDRLAAKGYRAVRRELLRAYKEAARVYAASGSARLPEDFTARLRPILEGIHRVAVTEGINTAQTVVKSAGVGIEKKFSLPDLVWRYLEEFSAMYMTRKIVSIETSLLNRINQIVRMGVAEGQTLPEISKRIVKTSNRATRSSAAVIARTEVHGAMNYASTKTLMDVGAPDLVSEWVAVEDERTREDHRQADGKQVPIGQPFSVGGELLMYPGDPSGSAGNVINCRCVRITTLPEAA